MVLFPTPFYFVYYISNLLSYIQNNFSYELARPIMGTIFLVILCEHYPVPIKKHTIVYQAFLVDQSLVTDIGQPDTSKIVHA